MSIFDSPAIDFRTGAPLMDARAHTPDALGASGAASATTPHREPPAAARDSAPRGDQAAGCLICCPASCSLTRTREQVCAAANRPAVLERRPQTRVHFDSWHPALEGLTNPRQSPRRQ